MLAIYSYAVHVQGTGVYRLPEEDGTFHRLIVDHVTRSINRCIPISTLVRIGVKHCVARTQAFCWVGVYMFWGKGIGMYINACR